jgi:RimJ/RimL family protein N-acetyltransferase
VIVFVLPILIDFPEEIVGERIVVRPFRDEDAPALYGAIQPSQEHLRPFMDWYDRHQSVGDSLAYIRRTRADITVRNSFQMGMFERTSERFLGGHGLGIHDWTIPSFEIGYWIREDEEGKGYVTEATRLLTSFAFDRLGANRLVIRCNIKNVRSARIPERLGFAKEGVLRNTRIEPTGELADDAVYSMVPEDYQRALTAWVSSR